MDQKLTTQVEHIDVVHSNVDMAMKLLGGVHQEQVAAARELKSKQSPQALSSVGESILGSPPPIPLWVCLPIPTIEETYHS